MKNGTVNTSGVAVIVFVESSKNEGMFRFMLACCIRLMITVQVDVNHDSILHTDENPNPKDKNVLIYLH